MKSNVMNWLKSNWQWMALNPFALVVLVIVATQGSMSWDPSTFDPELESGKWAIRFLLTCLVMTPLNTYLSWHSVIKLRKPTGLWAFAFAMLHVLLGISDANLSWLRFPMQPFIALGLFGLSVMAALAVTSNRWAMRHLAKNWKRLHRLVYFAGVAVTFHAILATTASKKLFVRDPHSVDELKIYLAVLVVLLVVRLPHVRRMLKAVAARGRQARQPEVPIVPLPVPNCQPGHLPSIYARDGGIVMKELPIEFPLTQETENDENAAPAPMDLPLVR